VAPLRQVMISQMLVKEKLFLDKSVTEYLFMPISTGNDMVKGTRNMYTWFSSHTSQNAKERLIANT
jgi:hypothetical protein